MKMETSSKSRTYEIKAKDQTAEIWIYEDIGEGWFGGLSAKQFSDDLKGIGAVDLIQVRLNSSGGSLVDGVAIYNSLKRHNARVEVSIDGMAASIASIIAMAGDKIEIAYNAMMMIHEPWTIAAGTSADFRKTAEVMDKTSDTLITTYQNKTGLDAGTIKLWMEEETWLNAEEAVKHGFADEITGASELPIAASLDKRILAQFKNIPQELLDAVESQGSIAEEKRAQSDASHKELDRFQKYYRNRNW